MSCFAKADTATEPVLREAAVRSMTEKDQPKAKPVPEVVVHKLLVFALANQ